MNSKMGSSCSSSSLLFLYITAFCFIRCVLGSSICSHEADVFIKNINFQCSPSISPIPPLEVNGDFLDRALTSQQNGYTSVLFYASWCPFSHSLRPKFDKLSFMFPQLEHLAVEQSLASPSIFSTYGTHSLPSILIVNRTSRARYSGPKDLHLIVQFYQKTTGFEPVQYVAEKEPNVSGGQDKYIIMSWNESSAMEIVKQEPYLAFAFLFLCLRVFLLVLPEILSRLKALWASYTPQLNLEIFGETSQLFVRALHMVDVRRAWTKLRLCKTRNFQQGAKSARVWASSLASVSLGESSSARSSSSS
ncbi:5'-adenylylsulfate reductase-like 5 [Hibiscus syriacus]|uniref:5'-adenylylsulfate reductase-like 5 n=1 Tax=Hibiscus syriacus TaxID=106335 RepID=A0A6A2ZBR7_HIBSY|nr:5'-adenylylsulfate reductase-like 5 [Hibiscus syriacus]KAE8688482.1 5'-adenylylsulfate reductase-like 5 [Hibiscus syriacus]